MSQVLNKYSRRITQPKSQGASQAMLYGTGMTEADMNKAQVGIASVWYEGNTCNMHLLKLAEAVKEGVVAAGLVGMRFNTIGVSDGISMGTDGMSYSLQSRDIIADSIETIVAAQWYDGCVTVPDGARTSEPSGPDGLRRNDPGRATGWPEAGYRVGLPVLWRVPGRKDQRERARSDCAQIVPRRGSLRRHVHRQYDGQCH
jgi:hypothetical protein